MSPGSVDNSGVTDEVEVTSNDDVIITSAGPVDQNDDGTYVYDEGVKGPAAEDTFEVHPNLVEETTDEDG